VNASSFGAGLATIQAAAVGAPVFTFTNKLTSQTSSVSIRATDSSGVSSSASPGPTEGSLTLRSGRLKVSNAFGSEKQALIVPVQAQYWNGKAWVVNSLDSCTSVPAASVVLTNYLDYKGAATAGWTTTASTFTMSNGNANLSLSAPSPTSTGSVDFAFNLGVTTTDQSCLSSHPASTAASLSWLRAQNGSSNSCSGVLTYDRDPSARATFGVYKPESTKAVFSRDIY
jgi:MSHA biogenesis protein MshQ